MHFSLYIAINILNFIKIIVGLVATCQNSPIKCPQQFLLRMLAIYDLLLLKHKLFYLLFCRDFGQDVFIQTAKYFLIIFLVILYELNLGTVLLLL